MRNEIVNIAEEIKNISNLKNELEYLEKSDLPLILYGAAEMAHIVKRFLDKNNIKIDSVVVDNEYWRPNMKFYEFDIQPLENVLDNNIKMNIILAFAGINNNERTKQLNEMPNVQKCLFFDASIGLFFLDSDFFNKNYSVIADTYNLLEDDLSRKIMLEFLKAKILMEPKELVKLNIANEYQYFPDFLPLLDNETFVDCGAYIGDTIETFLNKTNSKFNKIFAFEPDPSNYEKCKKIVADCGKNGIVLIEKGVWEEEKTIVFSIGAHNYDSRISESGNVKIEVDSIDNVCRNEKVTFIKMDVEGSELQALNGAKNQITANKPKLAICVYHKKEDLITIPQYILSLNPDYKLYLRHYGRFCTELVLYAI
ncbi:MAG: FkbM family methyltransferase [Chitinivibrionia bacterium]|nr:FkbM family methyltransferase [Chitinivibrionia bacterium]